MRRPPRTGTDRYTHERVPVDFGRTSASSASASRPPPSGRGRAPSDITLVAVSKTRPAEHVLQAVEAGQRDFGENYVQEARDKMGSLPVELRWHFIGHLQTNKAKYVAGRYALVHGVDRLELATELGKRALAAGVVQPVLIEVRLDPADTKGGADPEKALALAEVIGSIPGLSLRGLMGMPPFFRGSQRRASVLCPVTRPFRHAAARESTGTLHGHERRFRGSDRRRRDDGASRHCDLREARSVRRASRRARGERRE